MITRYIILEDGIAYDWDDYGLFAAVLYDLVNDCIVISKYGHGQDMPEYKYSVTLDEAIENNIVSIEKMINVCVKYLHICKNLPEIDSYATTKSIENTTMIQVDVVRGRKYKGKGYLIYAVKEISFYNFRNNVSYKPVIVDPKTRTIHIVNSFEYLKYDDVFVKQVLHEIRNCIENTKEELMRIAHTFAYKVSYSSCDTTTYNCMINMYRLRGLEKVVKHEKMLCTDIQSIIDETIQKQNIEKENAIAKLKSQKMPKLIEWVEKNTDKTGEDIVKLAEHIFNKKYT